MAGVSLGNWRIESASGGPCDIVVGRGIRRQVATHSAACSRVAILTQPTVGRIAAELAEQTPDQDGLRVYLTELPDGDAAKELRVVERTYEWLNSLSFTRDDLIVAIGGGALTDVAGFVAATYLRGVDVAYLPTTLLGAVDAAIGGKTGINVGGKNLAGVFRHPRRVIIDLDILDELPTHLLVEGAAEAVKAGFIAQPSIVDAYETHGVRAPLDGIVPEAIAIKVQTVIADFREGGQRAVLNYGHTIGHAVELAADIPHGHAVGIGMVAAGKLSEVLLGFDSAERQRRVIEKIGLPVTAPEVDASLVKTLIDRDKKRDRGGLRMILLEAIGQPVLRHVTDEQLEIALAAIGIEAR